MWTKLTMTAALCAVAGQGALAGPCDYRPSKMVAATASAAAERVKAVGTYALTSAVTGGSMMGASTTAGTTAATTGTAASGSASATTAAGSAHGAIGSALAGTSSVVVAAAAAVGLAGYEGLCYFSDRKVTKYNEILGVMRSVAANSDPAAFRLDEGKPGKQDATVTVLDEKGQPKSYPVAKLYIENNKLMFSKMGKNEVVGNIDFVAKETEALPPAATSAPAASSATGDTANSAVAPAAVAEPVAPTAPIAAAPADSAPAASTAAASDATSPATEPSQEQPAAPAAP